VDSDTPTTFNDIKVPPLTQLTPENFEEVTKDGYW
jgi:protein disulfide-isomerase